MHHITRYTFLILFCALSLITFPRLGYSSDIPEAFTQNEQLPFVVPESRRELPPFGFFNEAGAFKRLKHYHGQIVILNFWATWCPPCVKELPALNDLATRVEDYRLRVFAVMAEKGDALKAREFLEGMGLYKLEPFSDKSLRYLNLPEMRGLPTTLIIDPDGYEIARVEGDIEWDSPEIVKLFQSLKKHYFPDSSDLGSLEEGEEIIWTESATTD